MIHEAITKTLVINGSFAWFPTSFAPTAVKTLLTAFEAATKWPGVGAWSTGMIWMKKASGTHFEIATICCTACLDVC